MYRLLIKILFFIFPVLFILIGINYFVDPGNLFDTTYKYEQQVASHLLEGNNVTNISNMDERMLQKFFIQGLSTCPDVIMFGSSNSMCVSGDLFKGESFVNNAVSSSSLNDFIAIYDIYEQKGWQPKKVIMGLTPEMFNQGSDFWLSIKEHNSAIRIRMGIDTINDNDIKTKALDKWHEIYSFTYFQKSVDKLINNSSLQATSKRNNSGPTRIIDGSYDDGDYYDKKSREQINTTVRRLINKPVAEYEIDEPNPKQLEVLNHFVEYLQNKGVEVVFYQLVYHPLYYPYINEKYKIVKDIRTYILALASEKNIDIIGDNNPNNCNVSLDNFNDATHLNPEGLKIVFSKSL